MPEPFFYNSSNLLKKQVDWGCQLLQNMKQLKSGAGCALKCRLCVLAGKSYAEYLNFACNLPVENKKSDLTL